MLFFVNIFNSLKYFINCLSFLIQSFFIMLSADILYFFSLFKKIIFFKHDKVPVIFLLFFYFIWPLIFFVNFLFILILFSFRFIILFFLSFSFLYSNFFFNIVLNLNHFLKKILIFYTNYLNVFEQGFLNKFILIFKIISLRSFLYFYQFILPWIIKPFILIYFFFLNKYLLFKDWFDIKIAEPAIDYIDPFLKRLKLSIFLFFNVWFIEIIKFFIFFIPLYSWQTFIPLILNFFYKYFLIFFFNLIFYFIFFIFSILFNFIRIVLLVLNLFIFIIFFFFNLLFYFIFLYLKNLFYFVWLAFQIFYFFVSLFNLNFLKIFFIDLKILIFYIFFKLKKLF